VRTDPVTGITYKSVLKPIGESFSSRTADPFTGETSEFTIEPAADEEIEATVKVMGGEDWRLWIESLADAGVLSEGATTVAYSYIGPPATQSMYRHGTIGRAKEHLENTASELNDFLDSLNGRAFVSVNKALVTRASAVIPVVPLYISLLYRVMKEKSIHENCIHQVYRLFRDRLFVPSESKDVTQDVTQDVTNPSRRYDPPLTDDVGRIRMDDYEMREDVQREVAELWERTENEEANKLADFAGYRETFLQFHGFDVKGVDYSADVAP
jgi:enoyl-[acyl-carrier protein] reductase / trans-2-enoyl-CoA reductase (NAD+)